MKNREEQIKCIIDVDVKMSGYLRYETLKMKRNVVVKMKY